MIDGHGDDAFRYEGQIKINFSTNIHQTVDHAGLMKYLGSLGDVFRNYPEPIPYSVEEMLASQIHVSSENVMVTNGATEAIYMIAHFAHDGHSAIVVPTFREYQDACDIFNHTITFISTPEMLPKDCTTVWVCNPNNPTGRVVEKQFLKDLIASNPDKLFVIDQAYADYSNKDMISYYEAIELKNVILLSSLTKRFAVPGLRIGYAVGDNSVIEALRKIRMPWSVNSIAIESAKYLLTHSKEYKINANELHAEAMRISDAFKDLGISVLPTDCNFILAKLPGHSAGELKEWLIANYGILIRDASNFEGLTKEYFRIAAQSREENDILINALEKWMSL